jgi:hypothetical protein
VTSHNGDVNYTLQIAQAPDFSTILISKKGLTDESYQLTAEEQLDTSGRNKPYYWRVKAVDAALNEINWSTASTFTIGFTMPSWVWYMIYAVAGLLIFIGGYYMGSHFEINLAALFDIEFIRLEFLRKLLRRE